MAKTTNDNSNAAPSVTTKPKQKRSRSNNSENVSGSRKIPKRGVETKNNVVVDNEVSQVEFIYNQQIGLDSKSKENEQTFREMPVLTALRDENMKQGNLVPLEGSSCGGQTTNLPSSSSTCGSPDDEDIKLARLLQDEYWQRKEKKSRRKGASSSNKFSFKINEDEIANDYPLPAYYKNSIQETEEHIIYGSDIDAFHYDELPQAMLHKWSLYNSDSRLISLELLPMNPCANIDVTIYGSGIMTADDGSGYFHDDEMNQSSSSSRGVYNVAGMQIYLSAIKEWKIEFGSSMIAISIRKDMAWY